MDAGKVRKGNYIIVDGEPCKVSDIKKSKPGRHGAAKIKIKAIGVFDDKKHIIQKPSSANIKQPDIQKKKAQVIMVSGDSVKLMDMESYNTFEAAIPEEFKGKLESGKNVLIWEIEGKVLIRELR